MGFELFAFCSTLLVSGWSGGKVKSISPGLGTDPNCIKSCFKSKQSQYTQVLLFGELGFGIHFKEKPFPSAAIGQQQACQQEAKYEDS